MLAIAIEFTGTLFAVWSGIYVLSLCYVLLKYAYTMWRSRAAFREEARIDGNEFNELHTFVTYGAPSSSHSIPALSAGPNVWSGGGGRSGGGDSAQRCSYGFHASLTSSLTRSRNHLNIYPNTSETRSKSSDSPHERALEETESVATTSTHLSSRRSFSLSLNGIGGGILSTLQSEHELPRYPPMAAAAESSPEIDGSEIAQSQTTCAETSTRRQSITCRDRVRLVLTSRNSVSQHLMRHFLHLSTPSFLFIMRVQYIIL